MRSRYSLNFTTVYDTEISQGDADFFDYEAKQKDAFYYKAKQNDGYIVMYDVSIALHMMDTLYYTMYPS